jgi:hypothetical protein
VRDEDGSAAEELRAGVQALVQAHPAYGRPEATRPSSASTADDHATPS